MKFTSKNNSIFFKELVKKVEGYISKKNGNRFGNANIYLKGVLLILVYFCSYIILLTLNLKPFLSLLLAALMGLTAVAIVFNIVHDASHNVLFRSPKHNRTAAYLGDLVGINSYIWNIRHNMQHHAFTNVAGGDILIDNIPLIRISPYQKKYSIHKFQVYYVPLLYLVYSIFWVFFLDLNMFIRKKMGNFINIKHSWQEWLKLILFKSFYLFYMIILPGLTLQIPLSHVLTGFLIYHIAAGVLLSSVVVLGHCVEGADYVSPDENGIIQNSWMQHEWDTTYDCSTDSRILHGLTGGLNTHLAHHLFPKISHHHYYAITKIIKQHCIEYDIKYPHYSFGKAIVSHFKFLNSQANAFDLSVQRP